MNPPQSVEKSQLPDSNIQDIYQDLRLDLPYDNITSSLAYRLDGNGNMPTIQDIQERIKGGFGDTCEGFARLLKDRLEQNGVLPKDLKILPSLSDMDGIIHTSLFQSNNDQLYYHDPSILPEPVVIDEGDFERSFEYVVQGSMNNICELKRKANILNIRVVSALTGHCFFSYQFDLTQDGLDNDQLAQVYLENLNNVHYFRMVKYGREGIEGFMNVEIKPDGLSPAEAQMNNYAKQNELVVPPSFMSRFRAAYQAILDSRAT